MSDTNQPMFTDKLRAEYAPYDKMGAFDHGVRDYLAGTLNEPYGQDSVYAQAYDRGAEFAMRCARL